MMIDKAFPRICMGCACSWSKNIRLTVEVDSREFERLGSQHGHGGNILMMASVQFFSVLLMTISMDTAVTP
jgi:hypothetical protein